MKSVIISVAVSVLAGCSSTQGGSFWSEMAREVKRDPRDAPWDPPAGRQLFEQIPNWDRAADKICCGALIGQPDEYRRQRCHTLTPVPPRSNRC
jgi:hypothetical protein